MGRITAGVSALWIICVACAILGVAGMRDQNKADASSTGSQEADRVTRLPGQPKVAFQQFAGYVNIDHRRALFYWLTEAASDAALKPLILWLNGGPGCSSIGFGAMEEIGPFHINPDARSLYLNEHSWNQVANVLFLEAPAGVGFSYSSSNDTFGDSNTVEDSYIFLTKWFDRFPQYKQREFYLTGESYAGHFVPQLAKLVYERNVKGIANSTINLKGFMVGNPDTDHYHDNVGTVEFWWNHGLISTQMKEAVLKACNNFRNPDTSPNCSYLYNTLAWNSFGNIDPYNIYAPPCPHPLRPSTLSHQLHLGLLRPRAHSPTPSSALSGTPPPTFGSSSSTSSAPSSPAAYDPCTENYAELYLNHPDVQAALHAKTDLHWTACNIHMHQTWQDTAFSVLPIYQELMAAGLRIWVYSGDVDGVVPMSGTRHSLDSLNLKTKVDWYPWYLNGQVGGHCQQYEGLTYVTIRDAGHEVPHLQPERAFVLIQAYLQGILMPQNSTFTI